MSGESKNNNIQCQQTEVDEVKEESDAQPSLQSLMAELREETESQQKGTATEAKEEIVVGSAVQTSLQSLMTELREETESTQKETATEAEEEIIVGSDVQPLLDSLMAEIHEELESNLVEIEEKITVEADVQPLLESIMADIRAEAESKLEKRLAETERKSATFPERELVETRGENAVEFPQEASIEAQRILAYLHFPKALIINTFEGKSDSRLSEEGAVTIFPFTAVKTKVSTENCTFKIFDKNDEIEIFAIELMYNLMKHLHDTNFAVLPKIPRPSRYYSTTIMKAVALAWHLCHSNLNLRFQKSLPFMRKSMHNLFSYATCQAVELYDRILPHTQLVFIAAFSYELSRFLSREGMSDYLYVCYTLLTTLWKDQYEAKFNKINGWSNIEEALDCYSRVLDPLDSLFLPTYPYDLDDMFIINMEFDIINQTYELRPTSPTQDVETIMGELDITRRRRFVRKSDTELKLLQCVLNFSTMKYVDATVISTPNELLRYLVYVAMKEKRYKDLPTLLEEHGLEDHLSSPDGTPGKVSPRDSICNFDEDLVCHRFVENTKLLSQLEHLTGVISDCCQSSDDENVERVPEHGEHFAEAASHTDEIEDDASVQSDNLAVESKLAEFAETGAKPKSKKKRKKKQKAKGEQNKMTLDVAPVAEPEKTTKPDPKTSEKTSKPDQKPIEGSETSSAMKSKNKKTNRKSK